MERLTRATRRAGVRLGQATLLCLTCFALYVPVHATFGTSLATLLAMWGIWRWLIRPLRRTPTGERLLGPGHQPGRQRRAASTQTLDPDAAFWAEQRREQELARTEMARARRREAEARAREAEARAEQAERRRTRRPLETPQPGSSSDGADGPQPDPAVA